MAAETPHEPSGEAPSGQSPGRKHPPGRRILASVFLSWLGVLISWLLLRKESGALSHLCQAGSGCDAVLSSRYATILGAPLPWLGLGFYLLVFSLLLVVIGAAKSAWQRNALGVASWLSVAGLSFSVILMGIQFGVLRAFCPLCTASAVVILALVVTLPPAAAVEGAPGLRLTAFASAGMAILTLAALSLANGGSRTEVVAVVDGQKFTRQQMEEELAISLQPLEQQRHALEAEWVSKKADKILLDAEAKRMGTSVEELLTVRLSRLPPPTSQEVEARLVETGRSADPKNSAVAREELLAAKRESARDEVLNEIAGRHSVQIFLPPPRLHAMQIDLSTAKTSGPADAPVQLVVFSDFQCQYCARLAPVLQRLRVEFPNELMVAFRYFPLEAHARGVAAAVAAECAAEQDAFWKYHDRLFEEGGDLSESRLVALAVKIGLDEGRFRQCLQGDRAKTVVAASYRDAAAAGLEGAPAVFLNGRRVEGDLRYSALARRIKAELQRAAGKGGGADKTSATR